MAAKARKRGIATNAAPRARTAAARGGQGAGKTPTTAKSRASGASAGASPATKRPARKRAKDVAKLTQGRKPAGARGTKRLLPNATPEAAAVLYRELKALYPEAHCELDFRSPYQLLVATILSAQCTDKRVNMVTPELFRRYPDALSLAAAPTGDVEEIIKSTGFFRAKAKSLIGMAGAVVDRHGGNIPARMEDLVVLPGVGRKTANVVLGNAFGINVGVVVDTHVLRLAHRLGLTNESDPLKVERELMALFPAEQWTMLSHLLIWHGRRVCDARKPKCGVCTLAPLCPSAQLPA